MHHTAGSYTKPSVKCKKNPENSLKTNYTFLCTGSLLTKAQPKFHQVLYVNQGGEYIFISYLK